MTKLDNLKNLLIIAHDENVLQLVINGKPIACDLWQDEQDNYFINLSVNCYNVVNNDTVLLIQNPNNKQNKNYEMLLTSDYLLITLKLQ